jgi:hypothetical protein
MVVGTVLVRPLLPRRRRDDERTVVPAFTSSTPVSWRLTLFVGGTWFCIALAAILWSWDGHDPRYFASPDEAIDRKAAELVATSGSPAVELAVDDQEDLRHGRFWVTVGDEAIPAYPPVAYYVQALLLMPPGTGALFVAVLSALGVGAFAGAVCMLGERRRWIALLAPAAAFPAVYWMLRPWMNMSTFLVFLCLALFCWAAWRNQHASRWFIAGAAMVAMCAAVRPDYALFVFGAALIALAADGRSQDRRGYMLTFAAAGALAVALNLGLNALTTGEPLTAAYEIVDERRGGAIAAGLPGPFSKLGFLLLPYGLPAPDMIIGQLRRYWFDMGPMIVVSLGSIAGVAFLMVRGSSRQRLALAAGLTLCGAFLLTHLTDTVYGATEPNALLRHSVTRYWTPLYLLAAVPLLMLAMKSAREGIWVSALVVLMAVAVFAGREIYSKQPESLNDLRVMQGQHSELVSQWQHVVPANAVVYSYNLDKLLWPHWEIATLSQTHDHGITAASMQRALDSGQPVYVVQLRWPTANYADRLAAALASEGLTLTTVTDATDVYRVAPGDSQVADAVFPAR